MQGHHTNRSKTLEVCKCGVLLKEGRNIASKDIGYSLTKVRNDSWIASTKCLLQKQKKRNARDADIKAWYTADNHDAG